MKIFTKKVFKDRNEDFYYFEAYIGNLSEGEQKHFWECWSEAISKYKEKKLPFQVKPKKPSKQFPLTQFKKVVLGIFV